MSDRQSVSAEVLALKLAAEGTSEKALRKLRALLRLNRAYRRLFFDQAGQLKPEAREVLTDLVEQAGIGQAVRDLDPAVLAMFEGRRRMVLHIFGRFRLPQGRIDQLERDLQPTEDDER